MKKKKKKIWDSQMTLYDYLKMTWVAFCTLNNKWRTAM